MLPGQEEDYYKKIISELQLLRKVQEDILSKLIDLVDKEVK